MRNRVVGTVMALAVVVGILSLAPVPAAGQAPAANAQPYAPLRTPDGQPDLQGWWDTPAVANGGLDIEEHPKTFWWPPAKSIVMDPEDGKIPYLPWAAAARKENTNERYEYVRYLDQHPFCLPSGVPRQIYDAGNFQILQSPGYVVMLFEFTHAYRSIPLDGRPHVGEKIRLWEGDSRGRWEGNTLVVDVTNQNEKTWFDVAGNLHSDALHVVERFTIVDADTINYEATLEDPKTFTRPWKIAFPIVRLKEKGLELWEQACHEGNPPNFAPTLLSPP